MTELVGVATVLPMSVLKQQLLIFDRIALGDSALRPNDDQTDADISFLLDANVVFALNFRHDAPLTERGRQQIEETMKHMRALFSKRIFDSRWMSDDDEEVQDTLNRFVAIELREQTNLNAVPIVARWSPVADQSVTRAEVVQLVISNLPMPGEDISLEDILIFRNEMRSLGFIQGLRVWMNDMASGKLTPPEVSDKLEDLVSRFSRALQLERMNQESGVVETLVTTTAEIAESLVKFRWSKLAKKLFDVRHKQIDLLKAEMTLPGREVAYIAKARERFGAR